jgi:hypothetical protein
MSVFGFSFILFQLIILIKIEYIWPHGRLILPVSRSSRWRFNKTAPINYDDNQLHCGGLTRQWYYNKGKCGICGDDYNDTTPRNNELYGKYGEGIIVKKYTSQDVIDTIVDITANHRGYFRFSLCNLDKYKKETKKCFKPIKILKKGYKYKLRNFRTGLFKSKIIIPKEYNCTHCILRWRYISGNNWGICKDGIGRLGCGPQEEYRACSDISILRN